MEIDFRQALKTTFSILAGMVFVLGLIAVSIGPLLLAIGTTAWWAIVLGVIWLAFCGAFIIAILEQD